MIQHYDYHKDVRVASLADKYDQCHNSFMYDEILKNPDDIPFPFYDLHILSKYHIDDTKWDEDDKICSLCRFASFFITIFSSYNASVRYSTTDIDDMAKGLIVTLYEDFFSKLKIKFEDNFPDIYQWIKKWRDVTIEIIKEAFESSPASKTTSGKCLGNYGLLSQSLAITYGAYDELVRSLQCGPMVQLSKLILYNFWDGEYYRKLVDIKKKFIKNEQELQMESPVYNLNRFRSEVNNYISQAVSQKSFELPDTTFLNDFQSLISKLFPAYIELLRYNKIDEPSVYSFAAEYWCDMTLTVIKLETYKKAQQYRLADYHPGDIIHREIFVSSEHEKWDLLKIFVEKSETFIRASSFSFLDDLKNGPLAHPWAQSLRMVGINYKDLCSALCPKYIPGISVDFLKHCVESANFSRMQELCNKSNNAYGVLRFIVIAIGKKCVEWRETAASSLIDSNGNKYNWRKLDSSITCKKEFVCRFIDEISDLDIGLDFNWLG